MNRRSAFNLPELLVVLGIVALLMALLFPAMGKVREHSKTVQCLSQLRQIGIAIYNYSVTNRGQTPAWSAVHFYPVDPPYQNNPLDPNYAGPGWPVLLAPFIGQKPDGPVYSCPAFPLDPPCSNYFLEARWMYLHQPLLRTLKLSSIRDSSRFILSGDCTAPVYYPRMFTTSPGVQDDVDKDDGATKCLLFAGEAGGFNMHRRGNNVLFADGHAATFNAFDPSLMTYSPHANQNWDDVTGE
jgi:prepilin-type N-terminal cleavage/methylation domain-containing protein/prepilin-type processing-associated H-X9-DG protein